MSQPKTHLKYPTKKHKSATPKKQHTSSSPTAFVQRKPKKQRQAPTLEYICTGCSRLVVKNNACGTRRVGEAKLYSGLGKFKCSCGTKTVRARKAKSAEKEKVAA